MPELAEVAFYAKRWRLAAQQQKIVAVQVHAQARVFRARRTAATLAHALPGTTLLAAETAAKQMAFRFSGDLWLGLHLGMSGELRVAAADQAPGRHDHLVLRTATHALVFSDPRMFGRIDFATGPAAPDWWSGLAPPLLSRAFTAPAVGDFLRRHARAPLKAVLLRQERFPGIGNWMADEILWRAALHPRRPAGSLRPAEVRTLWRTCRRVARMALATIAGPGDTLPPDLNVHIPPTWLFLHRWTDGGRCPRTGAALVRETVGGRTSCWSPARQKLRP